MGMWSVCLLFLSGCYAADEFDVREANGGCNVLNPCIATPTQIEVCIDFTCVKPPIGTPTEETIGGSTIENDQDHPGVLLVNNAQLAKFSGSGANIINITADDLIIDGLLLATSPNLTVRLRARRHIWIKNGTSFQQDVMLADPVSLTIQAEGNVYIDPGVRLRQMGTCACIFQGDDGQIFSPTPWSNPACGRDQSACTRLPPL